MACSVPWQLVHGWARAQVQLSVIKRAEWCTQEQMLPLTAACYDSGCFSSLQVRGVALPAQNTCSLWPRGNRRTWVPQTPGAHAPQEDDVGHIRGHARGHTGDFRVVLLAEHVKPWLRLRKTGCGDFKPWHEGHTHTHTQSKQFSLWFVAQGTVR